MTTRLMILWARLLRALLRGAMRRLDPDGHVQDRKRPAWDFETTRKALASAWRPLFPVGTRSVLYGYHCFLLHPLFVFAAWVKLYGMTWDPRVWMAIAIHDLGYWGKTNMDGPEGELHPVWAARVMTSLFDRYRDRQFIMLDHEWTDDKGRRIGLYAVHLGEWGQFSLFHSRFLARKAHGDFTPSRLCVADKLAICLYPEWLYMLLIRATGEIHEYMRDAKEEEYRPASFDRDAQWRWLREMRAYVRRWVEANRDGGPDRMTTDTRETSDSGVYL